MCDNCTGLKLSFGKCSIFWVGFACFAGSSHPTKTPYRTIYQEDEEDFEVKVPAEFSTSESACLYWYHLWWHQVIPFVCATFLQLYNIFQFCLLEPCWYECHFVLPWFHGLRPEINYSNASFGCLRLQCSMRTDEVLDLDRLVLFPDQ